MSDDQKFDWLKNDMNRIESKVDSLIEFKWQIMGGTALLSLIIGLAIQVYVVSK